MTQTIALLVDAYRELNARKMFWISLIISGLVMGAFALLGVSDKGMTILAWELPVPAPQFWYKWVFSTLVVSWWVSLFAMVLALISTASIFPDLLAGGSVDLYLSKPISRLRLFLTKYLGGLLFVVLQTAVFAGAAYVVFGVRAGQWRASLFLIIPLATLLFSYLFAVCVLIGVLTRSTIAAILVTCLFWLLCFAANKTEQVLFALRAVTVSQAEAFERQAKAADAEIVAIQQDRSFVNAFGIREARARKRRDELRKTAQESAESAEKMRTPYRIVRAIATVIPKTGETVDLLDRKLFSDEDLAELREDLTDDSADNPFAPDGGRSRRAKAAAEREAAAATSPADAAAITAEANRESEQRRAANLEAQEKADRLARSRSIPWIIGTSVGFEVVVLSLAAWVFCRRDY